MKSLYVKTIGDAGLKTLGTLELMNIPIPKPGEEEALIRIAYNGICGSDGHTLRGNLGPLTEYVKSILPMPVGHEFSGVIEEAGEVAAQMGLKVGDRVVANYARACGSCYYCRTGRENLCQHPINTMSGCSEYICCHMSQIHKIPDSLSLKAAAMTEPFTIAFHAVEMAQVKAGSRVAVFGGGGIGQMAAQLAKQCGASVVTLFEPVKEKRELAVRLGVDNAYDSIQEDVMEVTREVTDGLGYDSVIEASGSRGGATSALQILSPDGNVVYFSMYPTDFDLPLNLFTQCYQQQKHIHGMITSSLIWPRAIAVLPRIEVLPLIQKVYTLDEYQQAFDEHMTGAYAKVMIHCNQDLD
ncbi:MAG: alcohol dehydrogenase catalytic domain-containing protein [Lachnospiraceae bacterium]|nr:alcohol dehydrogenase catalytic domain-containing protein [Lachnospiraceae bacterium]